MNATDQSQSERDVLRQRHYNTSVTYVRRHSPDLLVIRVRPDFGIPRFAAGQYATLGLGEWELSIHDDKETSGKTLAEGKLIRRAYSVSASLLNAKGQLVRADQCDYAEFYVALVKASGKFAPALTPRLFYLQPGDRLYCAPKFRGTYTLDQLRPSKNVIFAATGTGEAPHNAMLAELLSNNHQGKIASVVCVRYEKDLAYLDVHRELEQRYPNYRYLTLTTREPINLEPTVSGYVGKRYLQDFLASGDFEQAVGWALDPATSEVFLCGNPAMIGAHVTRNTARQLSTSKGMIEVLESRGFRVDEPHERGNIHFERYW